MAKAVKKKKGHHATHATKERKNPFVGILFCEKCGAALEAVQAQRASLRQQQDALSAITLKKVCTPLRCLPNEMLPLSGEIKNLQESEAELMRKKESGSQANQAAMEIIPTAQHILDNYDVLTIAEKNRLWKLVLKKATVYRTPDGDLSVHIYPKLPK